MRILLKRLLPAPVRRRLRAAVDRVSDPRLRHRMRARWGAARRARVWRREVARVRAAHPGRPAILIGLAEHLGDIVAAEPIVRHLRREHPDAWLVWAVRPSFREVPAAHPQVDATLPVGCLTEWSHLPRDGWDRVVDLHLEGRSCAECQLSTARRSGDRTISVANYYHHGNLLEVFCRAADLPALRSGPELHIPGTAGRAVDALGLPESFVALHCTSNQEVRDWTADRWNELVRRLSETGVHTVEVGLRSVVRGAPPEHTDLCGRLSILQTAEVIRRAQVFVGIDSGPAHLANAVGTPGVVLLGHYGSYQRRMPFSGGYADGSNAEVVQWNGPAAEIPVEHVLQAIRMRAPTNVPFYTAERAGRD